MKNKMISSVKPILADRQYAWSIVLIFMAFFVFSIYSLIVIRPVDIQIITKYSVFGGAHFYKNAWGYLYGFTALSLMVGLAHSFIMVRLYALGRRDIGLFVGFVSMIILIIMIAYFKEILKLAYL